MARKKKRNIKQVQTNSKSWFNKLMDSRIAIIIFFISIIINLATFISSIDTLQSKYNNFWLWFGGSAQFSGKWSNSSEGYVDGVYPETILKNDSNITINVDLEVKDHQVTGIITSSFFIDYCHQLEQPEGLRVNIKRECEIRSNMLLAGDKSPFKKILMQRFLIMNLVKESFMQHFILRLMGLCCTNGFYSLMIK